MKIRWSLKYLVSIIYIYIFKFKGLILNNILEWMTYGRKFRNRYQVSKILKISATLIKFGKPLNTSRHFYEMFFNKLKIERQRLTL